MLESFSGYLLACLLCYDVFLQQRHLKHSSRLEDIPNQISNQCYCYYCDNF